MWDEINFPFLNSNGATVGVYEWIDNFIPHFTGCVITYPCTGSDKSTHTMWHALHQDPRPSWANCSLHLEENMPQFWYNVQWKWVQSWIESRTPFGHKYAQKGPWLDSELVSPWPPHRVVPQKQSCHMLCGAWTYTKCKRSHLMRVHPRTRRRRQRQTGTHIGTPRPIVSS